MTIIKFFCYKLEIWDAIVIDAVNGQMQEQRASAIVTAKHVRGLVMIAERNHPRV